jgi:hypothetical protein
MKSLFAKGLLVVAASLMFVSAADAWRCTVRNPVNNTNWVGTGPTKVMAIQHAQAFCARNSVKAINCHNTGCTP